MGESGRAGLPRPSPVSTGEGREGAAIPGYRRSRPKHANYANTGIGTTSAVGVFPLGASPCGALDMAGNAWEWCLTQWRDNYTTPANERPGLGRNACVARGRLRQ